MDVHVILNMGAIPNVKTLNIHLIWRFGSYDFSLYMGPSLILMHGHLDQYIAVAIPHFFTLRVACVFSVFTVRFSVKKSNFCNVCRNSAEFMLFDKENA